LMMKIEVWAKIEQESDRLPIPLFC
jgi:hypothetical protein